MEIDLDKAERNSRIVLAALLGGEVISITFKQPAANGAKLISRFRMDTDFRLCQVGHNEATGAEVLLVVCMGEGIALSNFLSWCSRISDEDIALIAANHALNEVK